MFFLREKVKVFYYSTDEFTPENETTDDDTVSSGVEEGEDEPMSEDEEKYTVLANT
jgi:hypothetical protein